MILSTCSVSYRPGAGYCDRSGCEGGPELGHWMSFVFSQLHGLGRSSMATFYGIASLHEARAYLAHPILAKLGPRLKLCTRTVLELETASLNEIFGSPDDVKFQSSMTLFAVAAADPMSAFHQALDRRCRSALDPQTLKLLEAGGTGVGGQH